MLASQVIRVIVYVCRASQILVALIALGLTASLIPTFRQLDNDCVDNLAGIECRRIGQTLGGLRFSIGTIVLALVDVSAGLASMWVSSVPVWLFTTLDSVTAGFYLGSGSTIAARLNGELCEAGPSDPHFACGRIFAVMGSFFVGAITAYALVACFWASGKRHCRSCNAEVDDGHVMQDPFRDPTSTEAASAEGALSKRRSWSQLS